MPDDYTAVTYRDEARRLNVSVLAGALLFDGDRRYGGRLYFLSVLGPHSAVRGALAAAATWQGLSAYGDSGVFRGSEGGRMLTHALSREVTHGVYLAPEMLVKPDQTALAVLDDTSERVFRRLMHAFAIPALPEWAPWIYETLKDEHLLEPLSGIGATGCIVRTTEDRLDALLSDGVRTGAIRF